MKRNKKISDAMLLGVLRMPMPDDQKEMSDLEWVQFRSRAIEAADRIESDNKRFDEIGVFLKKWTALSQLLSSEDEHFGQTQFSARFRNEATKILYKRCC